MSPNDSLNAYTAGRISRRAMMRGLAATGVSLAAVVAHGALASPAVARRSAIEELRARLRDRATTSGTSTGDSVTGPSAGPGDSATGESNTGESVTNHTVGETNTGESSTASAVGQSIRCVTTGPSYDASTGVFTPGSTVCEPVP